MANNILVSIPSTVVSANGTTVSDPVALGGTELNYSCSLTVSDRTNGKCLVTVQTAINPDGPWTTWFVLLLANAEGTTFDFASILESPGGLLFARISAEATSIKAGFIPGDPSGFTLEANLMCQNIK